MNIIVQWTTILSPIVAVLLAIWAIRSSAKDTAKQMKALEENTTRQIESIKELSRQMIDATIQQVELEIEKNQLLARQAMQERRSIENINNSGMSHYTEWSESMKMQFREQKPERDYNFYCQFAQTLGTIKRNLMTSKDQLSK